MVMSLTINPPQGDPWGTGDGLGASSNVASGKRAAGVGGGGGGSSRGDRAFFSSKTDAADPLGGENSASGTAREPGDAVDAAGAATLGNGRVFGSSPSSGSPERNK
jgi:hypothetical protein